MERNLQMGVRGKTLAIVVCVCASLAASAGTAMAATNEYAPEAQARNFNGGAGGWTSTIGHGGLCIPVVTCYSAGAGQVANGGQNGAGDGFMRTELFTIADAITSTSSTLVSPTFVYQGAGGEAPKDLTFTLDRRTDLGALLPVINDNATYSVVAREVGGPAVTVIPSTTLAGAEDKWTSIAPVHLNANDLEVGRSYRLEITSTFQAGVQVIGTGTVDYDNVVLTARGGGGGGGGQGQAGSGGGLTTAVKNMIGHAAFKGNKLRVPVGCPKFVAPKKCSLRVVARLGKKGPNATAAQALRVKGGAKRTAKLRIKQAFKDKLAKRNKVVIRVRVSAAGKKRTVIKSVRIKH
jgi:hypothetical protein